MIWKILLIVSLVQITISFEVDKTWLQNVMINNDQQYDVAKVLSFEISPTVENLTTLGSADERIRARVMLKNGEQSERSVIMKLLPQTPALRKQIEESGIFKQEILIYRDVLTKMEQQLRLMKDKSEPLWIRAIDLHDFDRIILEDVEEEFGYTQANRWKGFDKSRAKIAVAGLAKFHALSAATNEKYPFPDEIKRSLIEKNYDGLTDFYEVVYNNFAKVIEERWGSEWNYAAKKIRQVAPSVKEKLRNLYTEHYQKKNAISALNIGAPNTRNVYFKYSISDIGLPTDVPLAVRFSYFQIGFVNSPVHDLQYLLNTSPSLDVMINYRDELLKHYHRASLYYLSKFNYKGHQWTYEEFLDEVKRTNFEGINMAIQMLPVVLEIPKAVDNSEQFAVENSKSNTTVLDTSGMYSKQYETMMKVLLKRALDENVI